MEKYHIYEEIGKGKFSQIFRGREKKSIEYVAIKRVDKNMMDKVVNEVQIIHRLDSPHTIKFHDWYETRNNLWLILEYCPGGDLASLIKQDGHLPETSVRMFSLDILAGLNYLHSMGLLHCDLCPNNILIDEYGILKISDFKYTRKIPKTPLNNQPLSSRGTPKYMAPELFSPEGVHSYSSDFWALGCVMYEIRCGVHPFSISSQPDEEETDDTPRINDDDKKNKIATLLERIRNLDPVARFKHGKNRSVHTHVEAALQDLLGWLLEKVPSFRCNWVQLCAHPFWGQNMPLHPQDLPPQPVYDRFIENHFEQDRTEEEFVDIAVSKPEHLVSAQEQEINKLELEKDNSAEFTPGITGQWNLDSKKSLQYQGDIPFGSDATIEKPTEPISGGTILTHISDSQVKPIVNNRAIESIEKVSPKTSSLQFQTIQLEQLSTMSQSKIESHLSQVYKSLQLNLGLSGSNRNTNSNVGNSNSNSQATLSERFNILLYLCTLSSNSDAANTVLNTVFLNLLLHLLKMPSAVTKNNMHTQTYRGQTQLTTKALGATALALFLRYATYVEPPKLSKEKDHSSVTILAVLVTLLRDPALPRQDNVLRRRALAALGEIVFYISAQEDDGEENRGGLNSESSRAKWTLPPAAVSALTKALSDDTDEISRHYAAKTIENVLAQGGFLSRRKFCSFEIAFRLLELSQHSRNTAIQTDCREEQAPKRKGKFKQSSQESPMSGAHFIARVLEKNGLVGFIDSMRDGRPRLQQAYLNIFSLIFTPIPFHSNGGINQPTTTDGSLSKVRTFFVKAHVQLLPTVCRLVDKGSSVIVQAKAVLAIALFCQYRPELTIALCEQRFHSVLMKLTGPMVASAEKLFADVSNGSSDCPPKVLKRGIFGKVEDAYGAQQKSASYSLYNGQCVLFLLQVLREQLSASILFIGEELKENSSDTVVVTTSKPKALITPTKQRSSSPGTNKGDQQGRKSPLVDMRDTISSQGDERLSSMKSRSDVLKATISLCSHPTTRRLVIGESFLQYLSQVFRSSSNHDSEWKKVAEDAMLVSLEYVSQLGSDVTVLGEAETCIISRTLIPAVIRYCSACGGDSRVVIVASLRRLLPSLVSLNCGGNLMERLADESLCHLPLTSLLSDQAPLPRYTVRLLTDMMNASEHASWCVVDLICGGTEESNDSDRPIATYQLVQTLLLTALTGEDKSYTSSDRPTTPGNMGGIFIEGDAHVAQLLAKVLHLLSKGRSSRQGAHLLFRSGLTSAILTMTNNAYSRKNTEQLFGMITLMIEALVFLKRMLGNDKTARHVDDNANAPLQAVTHLISLFPRIMSVLVWVADDDSAVSEASSLLYSIQQGVLDAFSLFLDINPQLVASSLSHDDPSLEGSWSNTICLVLTQCVVDGRLILKFLGLFLRFAKMTSSLSSGGKSRVLGLVLSESIHSALLESHKRNWLSTKSFARLGSAQEAVDAIRHMTSQLVTLAEGSKLMS